MTKVRWIVAVLCVAAGAGLTACGGSDSKSTAAPATPASTAAPATPAPADTTASAPAPATTTAETAATPAAGGGGLTPAGTTLKVGQTAHVKFKLLSGTTEGKTYRLDTTVVKIEKGTLGDFKNIKLDAKQKNSTPYYVTVKISNPGGTVPVKQDDPDVRFDGVDDRGQDQNSLIIIGTFDRCDDTTAPSPFTKGKSYTSCQIYLIPGGGSIDAVKWSGADEYYSKPITWK
jgi:hypothetical protein